MADMFSLFNQNALLLIDTFIPPVPTTPQLRTASQNGLAEVPYLSLDENTVEVSFCTAPDTNDREEGLLLHKMTATTPARTGVSPSSSPRLPSPPPFTEVQFGPKSPTIGDATTEFQLGDTTKPDEGARRRIRPGTKAADMRSGPPLVPLNELDSPFALQETLMALQYIHTKDPAGGRQKIPITKETATILATPPDNGYGEQVDKNLWLFELCRILVRDLNQVVVEMTTDSPPCTAMTCPEMRASEWQYLCAVHDPPKSCAAIDYCCHTLDWASTLLCNSKHFPSRMNLGGEAGTTQALRHLGNIFRRVYRIFAHAWFQHHEAFWRIETRTGLYIFFKTVCDMYAQIPDDNYTVPAEAEGPREDQEETPVVGEIPDFNAKLKALSRSSEERGVSPERVLQPSLNTGVDTSSLGVATNTRRHKHTPSTGSHVGTITEGAEEEDGIVEAEIPYREQTEAHIAKTEPPTSLTALPSEAEFANGLPRLHLGASTMPTFDPGAPEDPTPTPHDIDPMAAAGAVDAPTEDEGKKEDVLGQILGHLEQDGEDAGEKEENREEEDRGEDGGEEGSAEAVKEGKVDGKGVDEDADEDDDEGIGEPIEIPIVDSKPESP